MSKKIVCCRDISVGAPLGTGDATCDHATDRLGSSYSQTRHACDVIRKASACTPDTMRVVFCFGSQSPKSLISSFSHRALEYQNTMRIHSDDMIGMPKAYAYCDQGYEHPRQCCQRWNDHFDPGSTTSDCRCNIRLLNEIIWFHMISCHYV